MNDELSSALPEDFDGVELLRSRRVSIVRARSRTFGDVVVKVWASVGDDADRRAFLREVSLHQALSPDAAPHPSIVPFVAASDAESTPLWLATRAGGVPLPTWLGGRRLTHSDALRLSRDILDGLAALHERQVVHGDLTPANILVHHGRASLCDLGMAQLAGQASATPQVGTPEYMAPELLDRMGHRPDARSDVYAAGVILSRIFDGVDCSPRVDHLLTTKAQSQRPSDRPTDASDLAHRFTRAVRQTESPRRTRPYRAYAAGVAAAALLIGGVGVWASTYDPAPPTTPGAAGAPTPSPSPTGAFTIDDPGDGAAVDSPLTISGRHDLAPGETLWTVTRRGADRYRISLTSRLSLRPDSDRWLSTLTLGDGRCDEGHSFTVLMVALKSDHPLLERAAEADGRGSPILEYVALPEGLVVKASTKVTLKRYLDQRDYCDGQLVEETVAP